MTSEGAEQTDGAEEARARARAIVARFETAYNAHDAAALVELCSEDAFWRVRTEHLHGRRAIERHLRRNLAARHGTRTKKELWADDGKSFAVRSETEWFDPETGYWFRCYGQEAWQIDDDGRITRLELCADEHPVAAEELRVAQTEE